MNILKLAFSLILVISAGAASGVPTSAPVPVKGSVVSVSRDSAFYISDPLTKAVYTYSVPHTDHRVTTFTDSCGRIRVTEERAYIPIIFSVQNSILMETGLSCIPIAATTRWIPSLS